MVGVIPIVVLKWILISNWRLPWYNELLSGLGLDMIENSLILKLQINIHCNEIFKSRLNDEYIQFLERLQY